MLTNVLLVFHVLIAIAIIALILLQQGKGADAGAAFGSGASGTVFGARGSASFLSRATAILAALFFVTSLTLAYLASSSSKAGSVVDNVKTEQGPTKQAQPSKVETTAGKPAASKEAVPADKNKTAAPKGDEQKPKTKLPVNE